MKNHFRNFMLVVSWAFFLWTIHRVAADKPVSDTYWINLAYVTAIISAGIAFVIFGFLGVASALRPKPAGAFAIGVALMLAVAAVEVLFLRDVVAGWLAG